MKKFIVVATALAGVMVSCGEESCVKDEDNTKQQEKNNMVVKENRLANEASPYLRQHAKNPVDWYPWGEEAFAKARKENKPIFLSIGYSTCHWCHVMERESFENEEIAKFLNAHFISVKLDREERPDVDKVYMTAYQSMTEQGGGWPLNMFLTPDLTPFYGGTYFPPTDRGGRVGLMSTLKQLHEAWSTNQLKVVESAAALRQHLQDHYKVTADSDGEAAEVVEVMALDRAAIMLLESGDMVEGGWGGGPKFPMPSHLRFLLRGWKRGGDEKLLAFAELTAERMAEGGIHDHLDGGFHRYTVDGKWLVPHFEKMLYDQAQLLQFYLDLYQITKNEKYATIARSIADYVLADMRDSAGGFYCAEDAQSEGKEGKFFCWTSKRLAEVLSSDEYSVAAAYFGVTEEGNFYDHSDPEALKGQNVLSVVQPDAWLTAERRKLLDAALIKMRADRKTRVRPGLDDKVLASWNGMMISALARAGGILDHPEYSQAAKKAHQFVRETMWDGKRLAHRWHAGRLDESAQAESYLLMLQASRVLYEQTLDAEVLSFACDLADATVEVFYDKTKGGFYESAEADDVMIRLKGDYDGAMPTASSIGALEFLKLGEITSDDKYEKIGVQTLKAYEELLSQSPSSVSAMLEALDFYYSKRPRLVLALDDKGASKDFYREVYASFRPNLTVMGTAGKVGSFEKTLKPQQGKTTAYLCEGETCQLPITDPKKLFKK